MDNWQAAFLIVGVCGLILLILALKSHSQILLNFVYRCVSGTLLIFCINRLGLLCGISLSVGLNPYTVLTTGILGFPGVILLFGIKILSLL